MIQVANLIGICFFVLVGSPKFKAEMPVVNYVLAGMLVLQSLMNNRRLQNALKETNKHVKRLFNDKALQLDHSLAEDLTCGAA